MRYALTSCMRTDMIAQLLIAKMKPVENLNNAIRIKIKFRSVDGMESSLYQQIFLSIHSVGCRLFYSFS